MRLMWRIMPEFTRAPVAALKDTTSVHCPDPLGITIIDAPEVHRNGPEAVAARVRDGLNLDVEPRAEDLFDFVYATRTPQLEEQAGLLLEELAREEQG